jgi:hypothetical protein
MTLVDGGGHQPAGSGVPGLSQEPPCGVIDPALLGVIATSPWARSTARRTAESINPDPGGNRA